MVNTTTESNLGKRKVYLAYTSISQSIIQERQEGTQGRNLEAGAEQRPKRHGSYWVAPHGLLSLVLYAIQDHLSRSVLTTVSWALP